MLTVNKQQFYLQQGCVPIPNLFLLTVHLTCSFSSSLNYKIVEPLETFDDNFDSKFSVKINERKTARTKE